MEPPSTEDIYKWNRRFAMELNNLAWTLAEKSNRTTAEQEEMLHAAHGSALHWGRVGKELDKARADMLLGQVHALLRNGFLAITYARRAHGYIISHERPDWEMAFAHAILSHAAYAAKEMPLYYKHYARAKSLGEAIVDTREKDIFMRTFIQIPIPSKSKA